MDDERRELIESYLPLAGRIARRFRWVGEPADDLRQVAALAVVRAVDRRDPRRDDVLPAYVARCVEGELRRHARDRVGTIRVPRAVRSAPSAVSATARAPLPLDDATVPATSDGLLELGVGRALVARALGGLDAREREVVLLRFFADRTQSQIGDALGMSQVQVSRLLAAALEKMRRRLAAPLAEAGAAR